MVVGFSAAGEGLATEGGVHVVHVCYVPSQAAIKRPEHLLELVHDLTRVSWGFIAVPEFVAVHVGGSTEGASMAVADGCTVGLRGGSAAGDSDPLGSAADGSIGCWEQQY